MKNTAHKIKLAITLAALAFTAISGFSQEEKSVAFMVAAPDGTRYATTPPKGGLGVTAKAITARETFHLVDLNGGDLSEGDLVKIKYEKSIWIVNGSSVNRVPEKGADGTRTTFTIVKDGTGIKLKTSAGTFVTNVGAEKEKFATTESEGHALLMEPVINPVVGS